MLTQQGTLKGLKEEKPAKLDDDQWEEMQARAAAAIRLCLSDDVMNHIMEETLPKEIWDKLASRYMSKTLTNKLFVKQKFYKLKMAEGSDLAEHVNVFNQIVADLTRLDVKVNDEDKAIVLLCSLPESYEHLSTTLTYGKEIIKVEDITAALLAHDLKKKNRKADAVGNSHGEGLVVSFALSHQEHGDKHGGPGEQSQRRDGSGRHS